MRLKEVSKAKHRILERYVPAWLRILGAIHRQLLYVDCFAGAGTYESGERGSPPIVINVANRIVQTSGIRLIAIFVEKDAEAASKLRNNLPAGLSQRLKVCVFNEDAHDFVPRLLEQIPKGVPAFFFIDPYGHPLTIPVMNQILARPRMEILLTLMWYRISMDLGNERVRMNVNTMFGHEEWLKQPFMNKHGREREDEFIEYFASQLKAKYAVKFRIRFSPEDNVPGGENRTKYYLIHLSNHPKAALLMKEVMWPLGDEEGTFDYSAKVQNILIPQSPTEEDLERLLRQQYVGSGRVVEFDALREETYEWPFIERHYRAVLKKLEMEGVVRIERVESKRRGIKGRDRIVFGGSGLGRADKNRVD